MRTSLKCYSGALLQLATNATFLSFRGVIGRKQNVMNLKKLTLVSSVVLAGLLVPMASAQSRSGQSQPARPSTPQITARAPSGSASQFANRGPGLSANRGSTQWSNTNSSSHWRDRDRGDWRHDRNRRCYYPRYPWYYRGGYPSYGFGYPFSYGYGYPYYSASASLYYNGYHPYGNRSYGNRSYGYRNDGGGSVVVQVQQRLARAGYYRGRIDGVIGGGTRSAIRAWERTHGLRVDGQIDNRLLSTMGLA